MAKSKKVVVAADAVASVAVFTPPQNDDVLLAGLLDQLGEDDAGLPELSADDAMFDGLFEGADEGALEVIETADSGAIFEASADDEVIEAIEEVLATEEVAAVEAAAEHIEAETDEDVLDSLLAEVGADAEQASAKQAVYAEQELQGTQDGEAPQTDAAAITNPDAPKPKPVKKDAAPKEPKPARATSVTHNPGDLLKIKLGEKAADFLTFDINDATLDADALAAKQQDFVARLNGDTDAVKVKEKLSTFLVWLKNGGTLNTVIARALELLAKDGELTSGDKGNMQLNLLAKPLSVGTSRSQSNQIFMLFPILGLTVKSRGKMIANPDSALLPLALQSLGL